MSRKKLTIENGTISGTAGDIIDHLDKATKKLKGDAEAQKPFEITSASIKEGLCNYGYEIKTGPCEGDKIPNRKGSKVVHDDMLQAFRALNIHLAVIDDAFKHRGAPTSLDDIEGDDIIEDFKVTGFRLNGSDENKGIVLLGEKWVTTGNIGLETPKITGINGYPFYEQINDAVEAARNEVELYMNGKAAPKLQQQEIQFGEGEGQEEFEAI